MTQKQTIINHLREFGQVNRNWALSKYISRLGAIIQTLEKEGWYFEAKWSNGDYIYYLISEPVSKVVQEMRDIRENALKERELNKKPEMAKLF